MDKINILDITELLPGRQVGNTTRLVDTAIQLIFRNKGCVIVDHHGTVDADKHLFLKVIYRLNSEYDLDQMIESGDMVIDVEKRIIKYDRKTAER